MPDKRDIAVHVYDRNARVPDRKPNWWIRYSVDGADVREPGRRTKKETVAFAEMTRRQLAAGRWVHPRDRKGGRHLFAVYAGEVIERRRKRGVKTWRDEQTHVEKHLAHMFPGLRISDLTFRVVKQAFDNADPALAGRTVRNIHATLRAVLLEAAEDDLIPHVPPPLTAQRGHLPSPIDRDPEWRRSAVFERGEVAALVGCDDVPVYRRALYCCLFLTGARVGEVLAARVRDYDPTAAPLPSLTYLAEKTARSKGAQVRIVPVHPALRDWLGWWLSGGFELVHGSAPSPNDHLFPTASLRRRNAGHTSTSQAELYKQWARHDLPSARLRHRRLHDARRTFVSVSRSTGQDAAMVRSVTHRAIADVVLDSYTTFEWKALCDEVARVEWGIPGPPRELVHTSVQASARPADDTAKPGISGG